MEEWTARILEVRDDCIAVPAEKTGKPQALLCMCWCVCSDVHVCVCVCVVDVFFFFYRKHALINWAPIVISWLKNSLISGLHIDQSKKLKRAEESFLMCCSNAMAHWRALDKGPGNTDNVFRKHLENDKWNWLWLTLLTPTEQTLWIFPWSIYA